MISKEREKEERQQAQEELNQRTVNVSDGTPLLVDGTAAEDDSTPRRYGDVMETEAGYVQVSFSPTLGMKVENISSFLDVSKEEAQDLMDKYFGVYSKVKGYIHQHQMEVQQRGYVVNMFGRRRRMVHGDYHKAFNALIQSTATDICKIQMVRLVEALPEIVKMVLQVHDELLFEVKREEALAVLEQIIAIMETPVSGLDGKEFSVPIKVEANIASNWADAH